MNTLLFNVLKGCRFKLCNGWSTSSYLSEASHLPQFSLGGLSLWRYGHITVDLWWFVGEIQSFQNPCDRQFYLRVKKIPTQISLVFKLATKSSHFDQPASLCKMWLLFEWFLHCYTIMHNICFYVRKISLNWPLKVSTIYTVYINNLLSNI